MQRTKLYSQISIRITCLSNEKLKRFLAGDNPMHAGIGGKSAILSKTSRPICTSAGMALLSFFKR